MDEEIKQVQFSIPGHPFGKQRPKFSRTGQYVKTYTPEETVIYENLVKLMFREAAKGRMFKDGEMLDVRIIAYYEIPKSTSRKKRKLMLEHKIRPTKKPDWDNIGKIVCDSLNKVAYHDDSAVVDAQVRKFYSEQPRVDVTIRQIGGGAETVTEENAIEVVLFAKQYMRSGYDQKGLDMAVASLEICRELKEAGYCHNYQQERPDLAAWIDKINKLIKRLD